MRRALLLLLGLAACTGVRVRIQTLVHEDYDRRKPESVVVRAPDREGLREAVVEKLARKGYAPAPGGEATLELVIERWEVREDAIVSDGRARLVDAGGELLWSCAYEDQRFSADETEAVGELAALLLRRLP